MNKYEVEHARSLIERARQYQRDDTDAEPFCVVPNIVVSQLIDSLETLLDEVTS